MLYTGLRKFPWTIRWVSLGASNKNNSDLFFKAEEESCQEFFVLSVYIMTYIYIYIYIYMYIYIHSQVTVLKPHWMPHKIASQIGQPGSDIL